MARLGAGPARAARSVRSLLGPPADAEALTGAGARDPGPGRRPHDRVAAGAVGDRHAALAVRRRAGAALPRGVVVRARERAAALRSAPALAVAPRPVDNSDGAARDLARPAAGHARGHGGRARGRR